MIGMGSSRFAAGVAATRMRAAGVDAVGEYAPLEAGTPPGDGVLAIGISASGATEETIEALARHRGSSTTVALTNRSGSAIERAAGAVVPMLAGDEDGGGVPIVPTHARPAAGSRPRRPGAATSPARCAAPPRRARICSSAGMRGCPVADLLAEGPATFTIAPAERLSSAEQGALMLREGPRRTADACEAGDWLHVDVYLTKPLDYRALLFAGSRSDPAIIAWMRDRGPGRGRWRRCRGSGPHRAVPPRRQPRRGAAHRGPRGRARRGAVVARAGRAGVGSPTMGRDETDQVPSRRRAIRIVDEGMRETFALYDRLLPRDRTTTGLGGGDWSPKDLLGHLESWQEHALRPSMPGRRITGRRSTR